MCGADGACREDFYGITEMGVMLNRSMAPEFYLLVEIFVNIRFVVVLLLYPDNYGAVLLLGGSVI